MQHALKIVAEPRRQEILALIWDGERKAGDIAASVEVGFSAVSQHLKVLRDSRLVHVRVAGRERLYRANKEAMGPLAAYLEEIWKARLARLKAMAERESAGA